MSGFAIGEQQDVGHERINSYGIGGSDRALSEHRTTALEAGGDIVIKIHEVVGLYATLSWTNDLDGNAVHSLGGSFGLRVAW